MSFSNLNNQGLPDIQDLEALANQFFKGLNHDEHLVIHDHISSVLNPDTSTIFSSSKDNVTDSTSAGAFITKGDFSGPVAGNGTSPSAINHPGAFNVDDPQTSLPDPHFYNGQIPSSVAGSGRSPGYENINQAGKKTESNLTQSLPYEDEQPFERELGLALKQVLGHSFSPQIPGLSVFGINYPSTHFYGQHFSNSNQITDLYNHNKQHASLSSGFVRPPFDINLIKGDFPILKETVNGRPLVWLDNAATTHKPKFVIDRIKYYYEHENSNVHRAAHELAARSTDAYEGAREKIQKYLNARSKNEIVFIRGTTEAINLVAQTFGVQYLNEGDEIILSNLEHHANIVPWQLLAKEKGIKIRVIPVHEDGQINLEEYAKLLNSRTKLVSFTHVSNALGTITPAKTIIDMAHQAGAKVLLDGAQSISHMRVDLQFLNPDFFVFSGHKVFAPTGIGVLYGKEELLNTLKPYQGGGNMIKDVTWEHTEFHDAPGRFEAGTGNIADAVGLGAAIEYITKLGIDMISKYEHGLLQYATNLLSGVPGLKLIGTAKEKASVLSFVLDGYNNDDVGKELNKEGIAVRTGHHCAQPILRRFGLESTVRPSLAFYNTCGDIDLLVSVLHRLSDQKKQQIYSPFGRTFH